MREKARKSRTCAKRTRKGILALYGIIVSLSSTAREKSDPLFEKGSLPSQKRSRVL
nr:MAG TPA: hypothetical protein [Caudoviricetes sp.]